MHLKQHFGRGVMRVWIFNAAVAAMSACVWAVNLHGPQPPGRITIPWWGLAGAFYIAEAWVVHLHFRKQAHTLSLAEIGIVLGLFFATPGGLLAAQLVGAGTALVVHRRQKPVKLVFNLAEQTLCCGLALLIFHWLVGTNPSSLQTWAAAVLAAAVAHIAGVLLVSAVIAVAEGHLAAPQLGRTLGITLVGALATACIALVGVELIDNEPHALVLLVVPAIACGLAFRGYMVQREQREHLEFLYESMRATQGAPEFGLAVGQLLVAARRLLRAEYAEILLLTSTPGEPVLRSVSGASGELLMHPEPPTAEIELAFQHASSVERALLLSRRKEPGQVDDFLASRDLADGVLCALRGEERVFGVLFVGGRVGDVGSFDSGDLTLFETFAGHASVLLENGRLEQSLEQLTELKEELRHQAFHDALTGLPNRVLFAEQVAGALARHGDERHAVLYLDLDGFKNVNDSWGHAAGDALLVQAADRIRSAVRPGDTPARLSGDEFAVLLEDVDARGAERAAQRVVDAMEPAFAVAGRELRIHGSIGIALSGNEASSAEELIRNADMAMYTAKADERRRFAFYEPGLHRLLRQRRELAIELERAVDRNEIVVHYQPVVSLEDHSIRAFEALARWQHPDRGLLLPGEWVSVAEDAWLIRDIGSNVLEQSFRRAAEWDEARPEAPPAGLWINLAPRELVDERLVEDLGIALERASLDPRRVTLEITESSVIRDETGALRAMHRLRDLGLKLSIDDFGTGYSSLSRLAEFPIEMLKVPKPFVDRLVGDNADASFVDAILRLAGSLGLETVAEGIEHAAQARQLRDLGCSLGQGFLFSRPLPAVDALRLVANESVDGGELPPPTLRVVSGF
jgi:diguanylate cyclase (GGDEF)-like protein